MINQLRAKIDLEKLCAVFNDYMETIYPNEDLSYEEFDDLFSPILNNSEPIWKVLTEKQSVNIYEVFISLIVFVKDAEFEEKLLTIFKAFDINGSGDVDRKELSKFL